MCMFTYFGDLQAFVKKKYEKRIIDLKRQLLQRIPYRQVVINTT